MWYCLVFIRFILKFISIYPVSTHRDKQHHHFLRDIHCHGLVYYVVLQKYGFKVYVISFGFYSTHFKFYIHLSCINKQRRTTSPFDYTPLISSSNHSNTGIYQGLAYRCEVDCNSNIIPLLQQAQAIHYCNK